MEEIVSCQGCAHHHAQEQGTVQERAEAALEQARGLDRRELLKRGGLAAAAAMFFAACGSVGSDITGPSLGGSFTVKVASYPALASAGGVATVQSPGGLTLYVENTGSGYIALSSVCPHMGGPIQYYGSEFQCPVHGATFNKTGTWIGGQPTGNMTRFNVSSDGNGTLTIS